MKTRFFTYIVRFCGMALLLSVASCRSYKPLDRSLLQPADSAFLQYARAEKIPLSYCNRVSFLNGAQQKFDSLFADIRAARHSVHLEYFNFRNDSITRELVELLAQKVKQGVQVRAMFDAFGNSSNNRPLKEKHLKEIRAAGIEIVKYDPITFPWLNHVLKRDHRKIVVIDGRIVYTGGINVADYYIQGLPGIGPWRDMHLRIEGEAAADYQRIFLDMWNAVTGGSVGGDEFFAPIEQQAGCSEGVAVVDRSPGVTPAAARQAYIRAIGSAKEKIQIVNPYFVPTTKLRRAIYRAIDDGVQVEIMIPSKSDISFTPEVSFRVAHKMSRHGAKVYLFDGGFHHSKAMTVDGLYSTVGSVNLNSRSLRYDYEVNAFLMDPGVTAEISNLFEADKAQSRLLTQEEWKKFSWWTRFVGWVGTLLTPFL